MLPASKFCASVHHVPAGRFFLLSLVLVILSSPSPSLNFFFSVDNENKAAYSSSASAYLLAVAEATASKIVPNNNKNRGDERERIRIEKYRERGYEWPVPKFVPDTPGWDRLMRSRLEQVSRIEDPAERFKGYTTTAYPALVISNFTQHGFSRSRISDSLLKELRGAMLEGLENGDCRNEGYTPSLTGKRQACHIERNDLMEKVTNEMHSKLEEWAGGTELDLTRVYGLRVFRNETTIKMHIDKKGTHALGYILHVGSSNDYDPEEDPWPFLIEDFEGRTHETLMSPGDVILFEAAKLVHGRPHKLNGSWYCNVAGHYRPRDKSWTSMDHAKEAEYAVPLHWIDQPSKNGEGGEEATIRRGGGKSNDINEIKRIEFRGGLREPDCVDGWCRGSVAAANSNDSDKKDDKINNVVLQWKGPAGTDKQWIDANGNAHEFSGNQKSRNTAEGEPLPPDL